MAQPQQFHDVVPGEQYRYALTNFKIAHEKVEDQRLQLQEQEKQVARLRARIALLEGTGEQNRRKGDSVDDFSIKNAASQLERSINRWAADVIEKAPADLGAVRQAALADIFDGYPPEPSPFPDEANPMHVMHLLRHAMAKTISEGIINCLIVTDSPEANIQLTRIHEHIFTRDPTVAAVWRRQTFSAAVESCSPAMSRFFLSENMSALSDTLFPDDKDTDVLTQGAFAILQAGLQFSRMLHGSSSGSAGDTDAFYRAFVPELGSVLHPSQIELVKRCLKSEREEQDRLGATVFPGLVKVSRDSLDPNVPHTQTVVRRGQAVCECALGLATTIRNGA
ncbi:uncharacterized protein PHACADRAFT_252924 [Phanerochaete carnosa HHB-10118-sp]|uniref:Uncharacterized protein n=1 Tax=Phanerochaete carnosa (strain HHB-10118-sp) TaxID=650164 RepID=K5V706_PHACS|nr:uncharacterized protein PHACADRAFT_252924 [Phanerochaete carnosa HHB-10118-sp]EKM58521.1 hypothetical protein PHACADRAFT_252924 [Phanerochaete carnosa HHB-10118-sp]